MGHNVFIEGLVRAVEQVDGQTYVTIGGSRALWQTISSIGLPSTQNADTTPDPSNDSEDEETPAQAA